MLAPSTAAIIVVSGKNTSTEQISKIIGKIISKGFALLFSTNSVSFGTGPNFSSSKSLPSFALSCALFIGPKSALKTIIPSTKSSTPKA